MQPRRFARVARHAAAQADERRRPLRPREISRVSVAAATLDQWERAESEEEVVGIGY